MKREIIDFEIKGPIVKFYLGENGEQYGDDWNDTPYEYNAGEVYDRFIEDTKILTFDFDDLVLEPCDGELNSHWCKLDMVDRKVPCVIVVPKELTEDSWDTGFKDWVGNSKVKKFYFGDLIQ